MNIPKNRGLAALLTAMLLLAGCAAGSQPSKPSSPGGTELIYATAKDILDMNPHLYSGSISAQGMVYETLVENTEDGIKPLLAESWDISPDGISYTFHLRKGVTFHDGHPFNAEAVKQNIEAVQRNASKHAWIKLSAKITDVIAVDEHTVRLKLSEPYYPALLELAMTRPYAFLSPNDFIHGETKDGVQGYDGTGPYQLEEHRTDQYAVFKANDSYWGGAPQVKRITAKVLPAGETTLLALQKGEVNFIFTDDRGADTIDVSAMNQLARTGKYRIVRSGPMNTKLLVANSSRAGSPVQETAVREAIWYAIDRDTISEQIMNGTETPAHTLFSSNVNYADIELKARGYDLDKAAELLDEAGWGWNGSREVRTKAGSPLAVKLYYDVNSPSQKAEAEFIQSTAGKAGIRMELYGEQSASIAQRRSAGDYDLLFNQTWGLAYDPQSTVASFASEAAYYHTTKGIANAEELYRQIDEVASASDDETRKSLYEDILTTVHNEAVFIPITNGSVTVVAPADLQGLSFKQTQYELPFERMFFK